MLGQRILPGQPGRIFFVHFRTGKGYSRGHPPPPPGEIRATPPGSSGTVSDLHGPRRRRTDCHAIVQ